MTRLEKEAAYRDAMSIARTYGQKELDAAMRDLALRDLYFLLTVVLGRQDVRHDWLYARCMEVQAQPDGMLDLWARDHRKSTIITFGLTIQDVLRNPEETAGIFSHTKTSARGFLVQIKNEFENNKLLYQLSTELDLADARFIFREKYVDLDVAMAKLPDTRRGWVSPRQLQEPHEIQKETSCCRCSKV